MTTALELRAAFGCIPSPVGALCALDGAGRPDGMVASTLVPVSLDPALVSVCVQLTSATWPRLRRRPRIGLSVLSAEHGPTSRALAATGSDRFAGVAWTAAEEGAVLVDGAALHLQCVVHAELPAGDHLVVLLEVQHLTVEPDREPLVFHRSTFRRLTS